MDYLREQLDKLNKTAASKMSWENIGGLFGVTRKLLKCYAELNKKVDFKPEVGIVLGSGLGGLVDKVDIKYRVSYTEISNFPKSTVDGHKGEYVFGYLSEKPVVLMSGRVHYYEGYSMEEVVLPVRLMALMGADTILLTNAAGGLNRSFKPGTLMCINDHISNFVPSPLIGPNDILGPRFPDMSEVYTKSLQEKLHEIADSLNVELRDGVYLQTSGPNYETPAEIRMFATLGADAIGMSTACEAMALNHMDVSVCGISCITNMASGFSDTHLSHEEVKETADRVADEFERLVIGFVESL